MKLLAKIRLYLRHDDRDADENKVNATNAGSVEKAKPIDTDDNSDKAGLGRTGAVAAVVGALAFASTPAHASINGILKKLVSMFADMFKPLIEGVMGAFSSILNQFTDQSTGGLTAAMAKGFDVQLQANKEISDNVLSAAIEPPPQMCASDTSAKGIIQTEGNSTELASNLSSKAFDIYTALSQANTDTFEVLGKQMVEKYSNKEEYRELFDTSLVMGSNISTAKERVRGVDSVNMATYSALDSIKVPYDRTTVSGKKAYLRSMSAINKVETARQVLLKNLSNRIVVPGDTESSRSLLETEVNRTYGGEAWRGEIASFANPTPLIAEACKLLSLNNKLLLAQYDQTQQANQISALQLIDQVGSQHGR
ncbi:hypothetical protein ACNO5E_08765 [Vibrio parahaemolyticus]|nr:hypothetical protein AKH08_15805 [Vibrio parahaemolyticus]